MTDFGIIAGGSYCDVYKWEKARPGNVVVEEVAVVEGVYVGTEKIWPTYQEEFHWYEWNTPGYDDSISASRYWTAEIPEWATSADVVLQHTGGRGFDGARGFGNNDGGGGTVWMPIRASFPIPDGLRSARVRIGRPGTYGTVVGEEYRVTVLTYLEGVASGGSSVMPPPTSSAGRAGISSQAFGRSWPGGIGGALDQPGRPYGGAGGGGQGAPPVGGDRRNGQNGAPGYAALRFRSGPVPDGHVWPENPDWTNPQ